MIDCVIIGGGFSGTLTAYHLAQHGLSARIVEQRSRAARGAAYSTRDEAHLLNVRAANMSAFADRPGDFAEHVAVREGREAADFVPRRAYADYLDELLGEARATGLVDVVSGRAVAARPGEHGWRVQLADGRVLDARTVLLAIGNQPPEPLALDSDHVVDDPWDEEGRARIAAAADAHQPLLAVGTGLTMVDVALTLMARAYRGRLTAVSRRGLLPRAHADAAATPVTRADLPHGLSALTRWLRARARHGDWRSAIDSLRPHSASLWQGLTPAERGRFLRHARPWWDVHRHRIAPAAASAIDAAMAEGRVELMAGRILAARDLADGIEVRIAARGQSKTVEREAALVINCTGPLSRLSMTRDSLVRQLLEEGLVRVDAMGIGLETAPDDGLPDAPGMWAIGPLTKGRYWEITAVPDIRVQAEAIARSIVRTVATPALSTT